MEVPKLLLLETNERKNLVLWMLFGSAIVFTGFAGIGLFLVKTNLEYVFYLAILAHIQIITIMTGFVAQLVKRRLSVGKDGLSVEDSSDGSTSNPTE